MRTRMVLYADEDKVLTDGQIYGKQIFLAEGRAETAFYEISLADYEERLAAERSLRPFFSREEEELQQKGSDGE